MRRKDREVTDLSKVISIIEECECCRIGLVDEDEAYIVPMNFGYEITEDEIKLYFHCAKEGRKMNLLPKQKNVSFEMDTKHALVTAEKGCDFSFLYQCVMGKGKMRILEHESDKMHGLNKIMQHYTKKESWEFDSRMLGIVHVLELTVTDWSCKVH